MNDTADCVIMSKNESSWSTAVWNGVDCCTSKNISDVVCQKRKCPVTLQKLKLNYRFLLLMSFDMCLDNMGKSSPLKSHLHFKPKI